MRLRGVFTCCVNFLHSPPSEPSAYKGAYTGYVSAQPRLRTLEYAPIGVRQPVARLCNPSPPSAREVRAYRSLSPAVPNCTTLRPQREKYAPARRSHLLWQSDALSDFSSEMGKVRALRQSPTGCPSLQPFSDFRYAKWKSTRPLIIS